MQKQVKIIGKIARTRDVYKSNNMKFLQSELMHTRKQLIETQDKLASSKFYEEFYEERYHHYMQQCVELENEIKELKTENKKLKLAIMAFKSVWNAHVNRKEA